MKKIPCLFVCDYSKSKLCSDILTPGCGWVLAGEGVATIKRDGTACALIGGHVFARYDCKKGKSPPAGAIPCEPSPDPITGHWPHWVLANRPEDKFILEAMKDIEVSGTYEACGPKINSNHERLDRHLAFKHGCEVVSVARSFSEIREFLRTRDVEGIVFHHPDGRMCKIRKDHFGFIR